MSLAALLLAPYQALAQTPNVTAAAVKWQSVGDYQPHDASAFSTNAPTLYDNGVGDTSTGYNGNGSLCVLWDLGSPVSLSRVRAQFVTNYEYYAYYSDDGTTWTEMDEAYGYGTVSADASVTVTARYVQFLLIGSGAISFTDTRLYDSAGTLIDGPVLPPPSAPIGLSARAGNGQIMLSWTAPNGAVSYNLYRAATSGAQTAVLVQTNLRVPFATDTGLTNGSTYYYTVKAVSNGGEGPASAEVSAAASASAFNTAVKWQAGNYDPAPASSFSTDGPNLYDGAAGDTATGYGTASQQIRILWDLGDTIGLSGYQAQFEGSGDYSHTFFSLDGDLWLPLPDPVSGQKKTFPVVTARFVELVVNDASTVTDTRLYDGTGALILGPGQPPAAPTGFSASGGGGQILLSWTPASGVTSYNLYRGMGAGAEYAVPVQTGLKETSFSDSDVAGGTLYSYTLTGVNAAGESVFSAEALADPAGTRPYNPADWVVENPNGVVLTAQDGGYPLFAAQSGSIASTYPPAVSPDFIITEVPPVVDIYQRVNWSGFTLDASNSDYGGTLSSNYPGFYGISDDLALPWNGALTANVQAHLQANWVWIGAGAPPTYLDMEVTTTGDAYAWTNYTGSTVTSGILANSVVTDSLGDSVSAHSAEADPTHTNGVWAQEYVPFTGRHPLRVPVVGGIAKVVVTGNVTGTALNGVPYGLYTEYGSVPVIGGTFAWSSAQLGGAALHDNRAVTISSPIETSYYKSEDGDTGFPIQLPHQRNADGSIAVDSVLTWHDAVDKTGANTGFPKGWQVDDMPLTANPTGFFSSSPTYSWSLSNLSLPEAWLTTPSLDVAGFNLLETDITTLPRHATIHVNVTDSDNAVATNIYNITWHLPYEVINRTPFDIECGKYNLGDARVGPVEDGHTLLVQETKPTEIDWATTIDGATAIAAGTGQEEIAGALEILGDLAKVTNFKTEVGPEASYNGATNGDDAWSDAQQENGEIYGGGNISPDDLKTDPSGWQLCDMYIFQEVHYTDKSWYADGYNSHGYDGNSQHVLYVRNIDYVHDEFQFIKYKNRDGSPYNP